VIQVLPFDDPDSVDRQRLLFKPKLENGDLLDAAEEGGFQVLITTDQNLRYQRDLGSRYIALSSSSSRRAGREFGVRSRL
jgi:hypothetical protein